jgi:hypothetical protein
VLFEEEVIIVADHLSRYEGASVLTARFFGDNSDGGIVSSVLAAGFRLSRPGAVLHARVACDSAFSIVAGTPFVPEKTARKHPFIDIVTAPSDDVLLVAAMAVANREDRLSPVAIKPSGQGFAVTAGSREVRIGRDGLTVV